MQDAFYGGESSFKPPRTPYKLRPGACVQSNIFVARVLHFSAFIIIWSTHAFLVYYMQIQLPEQKTKSTLFEDTNSIKTEIDSLYQEEDFRVVNGYTLQEKTAPDTTGSSGYGSGYGSVTTANCVDYRSRKLNDVDEELGSMQSVDMEKDSSCLQDHIREELLLCLHCNSCLFTRNTSTDSLNRLHVCACVVNCDEKGYVKLSSLDPELVNQLLSRDDLGTRLSV